MMIHLSSFIFRIGLIKRILCKYTEGILVSAQAFCFTISKVVFASLSDHIPFAKLIFLGMIGVGLATVSASMSTSFYELLVTVIINGCVQGAGWTPSTLLIKKWSPEIDFGSWYSLFGASNTISGMVLPYAAFLPWRIACWYAGASTLLWLLISFKFLREDFNSMENVNKDEEEVKLETGLKDVLTSTAVLHVAFAYAYPLSMRTVCETWFPVDLIERGISPSGFQFFNEAGGLTGVLVSGMIVDFISRRVGVETSIRNCAGISTIFMMIIITLSIYTVSAAPSVFGFLCGFSYQACINCWGLCISRIAPLNVQGSASALISLVANIGSVLAGAPLSWLQGEEGIASLGLLFFGLTVLASFLYTLKLPIQMEATRKEKAE
ncbi:unnamed protein product, partial [Mesorhabditis belari]|uniref:Major facilitator superfamily (MFS) profile domain-containing protein n=1 Tax=Mesorhabditis belari TaxID=2138241 RepID=A0AAF3FI30_9BILA